MIFRLPESGKWKIPPPPLRIYQAPGIIHQYFVVSYRYVFIQQSSPRIRIRIPGTRVDPNKMRILSNFSSILRNVCRGTYNALLRSWCWLILLILFLPFFRFRFGRRLFLILSYSFLCGYYNAVSSVSVSAATRLAYEYDDMYLDTYVRWSHLVFVWGIRFVSVAVIVCVISCFLPGICFPPQR